MWPLEVMVAAHSVRDSNGIGVCPASTSSLQDHSTVSTQNEPCYQVLQAEVAQRSGLQMMKIITREGLLLVCSRSTTFVLRPLLLPDAVLICAQRPPLVLVSANYFASSSWPTNRCTALLGRPFAEDGRRFTTSAWYIASSLFTITPHPQHLLQSCTQDSKPSQTTLPSPRTHSALLLTSCPFQQKWVYEDIDMSQNSVQRL